MNYSRLPTVVLGLGVLLTVLMLAESVVLVLADLPLPAVAIANMVTSVPFVAYMFYSGYRLRSGSISTERYPRIAKWTVAGFVFFVGFFLVVAMGTQEEFWPRLSVVRWAAAAGGGIGLLVGQFEARAIERAVVNERTRIENVELERANERLDEFASIISHDLRNPLNVALGNVELVAEDTDDERLERAHRALERAELIVEETLELARSGEVIDEPSPTELAAVAEESWTHVDTRDASLEVESTSTITADPERLQQIFENLFRNAVEHAGPGVRLGVGALPDGFYVEDDGRGILSSEGEHVVHPGTTAEMEGSGFGLTIVTRIVEAHGWTVTVTQSEGGGARFEFTGVERAPVAEDDRFEPDGAHAPESEIRQD